MSIRRFSKFLTGPVFIVLSVVAGCNRRASNSSSLALSWTVSPEPVRVGHTEFTLSVKQRASSPSTGARIRLEADMAHPGMAPVFGDTKEIAPGTYRGELDLTMPGDWVVLAHGNLSNGEKFERQIELNGVGAR